MAASNWPSLARRVLFPARLAVVRLRHDRARALLLALGIATSAALLGGVMSLGRAAEDAAFDRSLAAMPAGVRTIRAALPAIPAAGRRWSRIDRDVRAALEPFGVAPVATVIYPAVSFGNARFAVAAVDGLARWIELEAGRLPARCRPSRCEVVRLDVEGPIRDLPGLNLVAVGTGSLVESTAGPSSTTPIGSVEPYGLFAEGAGTITTLDALAAKAAVYHWAIPLAPDGVAPWDVEDLGRDVDRARSRLSLVSDRIELTAPVDELRAMAATSRVAGRRLLLIGGGSAALLFAFTLMSAAGMRREADLAAARLVQRGARRWQVLVGRLVEAALVATAGVVVGWCAGVALGTGAAAELGSVSAGVVSHSLASTSALAAVGLLVAVTTALLLLALTLREVRVRRAGISPLDVAALGALAALGLSLSRGTADAATIGAEGGSGAFLLLLPVLVLFVAAVVFARLLVPVLRGVDRVGRRAPLSVRLTALSLARNPGYATLAMTFVVISLGLAIFAATYRSTLERAQRDQASFSVPLDAVVRKLDPNLPLQPALARRATPVLRLNARASGGGESRNLTLLGLSADVIASLRGWRGDFADESPEELARRLQPPPGVQLRGARLPEDADALWMRSSARGRDLEVTALVRTRRGRFETLELGSTERRMLAAPLSRSARGGDLVSLAFTPVGRVVRVDETTEVVARGSLVLELMPGLVLEGWRGSEGIRVDADGNSVRLTYAVSTRAAGRIRPPQATDATGVALVVTPALAAGAGSAGTLPIEVGSEQLSGRVVGVAKRFPTVGGEFAIADVRTLQTALGAENPFLARVSEFWVSEPDPEALDRLLRQPFGLIERRTRAGLLAELGAGPLARATVVTLIASSIAALALALIGVALGLLSDLRDERREFFELEAEGADPALLRRHLRLRALLVGGAGLAGGVAAGAALALTVVAVVQVTANATSPEPPMIVGNDWRLTLGGLAAYTLAAAVVVRAITGRAFRGRSATEAK